MATATQLRRNQDHLAQLAAADLAVLWRKITDFAEARIALNDVLPKLIETYGLAAAAMAADWYDQSRAKAAVKGRFTAIPADIGTAGADALAGWSVSTGRNLDDILTLAQGGMQRRIAMASRDTVIGSALADPRAEGWQRQGAGSCDFCEMLISRGAVYTEASADFAAHDHCHCVAVPAFAGRPRPVQPYRPSVRQSEADAARAKEWIKTHNVG